LDIGGNNDLDVCLELSEVSDTKEERGECHSGSDCHCCSIAIHSMCAYVPLTLASQ
jgi:hypothetical protein